MIFASTDDWRIMTGIAEVEMACVHIKHTNEHGNKHAVYIVLATKSFVHAGTYFGRQHALVGHGLEQACGLRHKQRCRHSLTAHIAHGKVEHVVANHIAIQVATNLLGGGHRGIHIQPLAMRESVGHHTHLYVARNLQFAFYALLSSLHLSSTSAQK